MGDPWKALQSAQPECWKPCKNKQIPLGCPCAPRGSGRSPDRVSQKSFKNVVKTKVSEKTSFPANPTGPSGAPSAPRGSQSFPKAHVEKPWKSKENEGFLCGFQHPAVGREGGDQRGPNPGQGFPKTVQKRCKNKGF